MASDTSLRSALSRYSQTVLTVADEPMIVDLVVSANAGQHWVAERISFLASLTSRAPDTRGVPPICGLFLCPPGTSKETNAQAVAGWNPQARPVALPLNDPYLNTAIVGTTFAVQMVLAPGQRVTIPFGWFLRAIIVCAAGSATPGPGAASSGELTAMMTEEFDGEC